MNSKGGGKETVADDPFHDRALIEAVRADPRPHCVIRVGGIGTRDIQAKMRDALSREIRTVMACLKAAVTTALNVSDVHRQFACDPRERESVPRKPRFCVVSPLADGADRIIAQAGIDEGYKLAAILPFEAEAYSNTFGMSGTGEKFPTADEKIESQREFAELVAYAPLPGGHGVLTLDFPHKNEAERVAAYRAGGNAVLWWSDFVIAIVTPKEWPTLVAVGARWEKGEHSAVAKDDSETMRTLKRAAELNMPTVAIRADKPGARDIFFLEPEKKRQAKPDPDPVDWTYLVARLLDEPRVSNEEGEEKKSAHGITQATLMDYAKELFDLPENAAINLEYKGPYYGTTRSPPLFWAFSWLNRWGKRRVRSVVSVGTHMTSGLRRGIERLKVQYFHFAPTIAKPVVPVTPPDARSLPEILTGTVWAEPYMAYWLRQHRADQAANANSDLYRSVNILIPALVIFSVVLGAIKSVQKPDEIAYHTFKSISKSYELLFGAAEFGVLVAALMLVFVSLRKRWLHAWLATRLLAETLRYSKFLLLTGRVPQFVEITRLKSMDRAGHNWVKSYARHIFRAQPLAVPGRGLQISPDAVTDIANYIRKYCIYDQIEYHNKTRIFHKQLEELLRLLGEILGFVTVIIVGLEFLSNLLSRVGVDFLEGDALKIPVIVLPALTGAILTWRMVGEHDAVARRSELIMEHLHKVDKQIADAQQSGELTLDMLGESMNDLVLYLMRDVDGWADLFSDKRLGIA